MMNFAACASAESLADAAWNRLRDRPADDRDGAISIDCHCFTLICDCFATVCATNLGLFDAQRVHHYLALPLSLLTIPIGFYAVVITGEYNLEELADVPNGPTGWISPIPTTELLPFWTVWDLFFHKIYWQALPPLFGTWLSMYCVVAFGSCEKIMNFAF